MRRQNRPTPASHRIIGTSHRWHHFSIFWPGVFKLTHYLIAGIVPDFAGAAERCDVGLSSDRPRTPNFSHTAFAMPAFSTAARGGVDHARAANAQKGRQNPTRQAGLTIQPMDSPPRETAM